MEAKQDQDNQLIFKLCLEAQCTLETPIKRVRERLKLQNKIELVKLLNYYCPAENKPIGYYLKSNKRGGDNSEKFTNYGK